VEDRLFGSGVPACPRPPARRTLRLHLAHLAAGHRRAPQWAGASWSALAGTGRSHSPEEACAMRPRQAVWSCARHLRPAHHGFTASSALCASDQYLLFTVDDRDISAVDPTDSIQRSSLETADGLQSGGLCGSFIHRRRALDHEIQHVLIIQQARDAPGCQLPWLCSGIGPRRITDPHRRRTVAPSMLAPQSG
jgi:hypothetical protein